MKKLFIILIVMVVCTSIVIGCAEPTATTTTTPTASTTTTPTATTTTTPTTSTPKYGGILNLRERNSFLALKIGDPLKTRGPAGRRASLSLERLLTVGDKPGTFKFVLATNFELAPDKSYYDISLRQGVKFHDGTDFNAQAVKWNLDRVKAAKMPELDKVKSIDVIDDYTIRLNLSSWNSRLLVDLTHSACFLISPAVFETHDADWVDYHPVGTGPFVFKEVIGDVMVFEKNNNYWQEGLPYLDQVRIHPIPDATVFMTALKTGEIDGTPEGSNNMEEAFLMDSDPNSNFQVLILAPHNAETYFMNTVDPESAWSDPRMRQALEYAIDKDTTINAVSSFCQPSYTIIKGVEAATQINTVPRKYNPTKAKELMTEAGHPDGLEFTIYIESVKFSELYKDFQLAWQEQMAQVGFVANFEILERAKMVELIQTPLPGNSLVLQTCRGNKNPIECVLENYQEGAPYFIGVKKPAEFTSLLEQALQAEDPTEQLALIAKIEELAYNEAMVVPLYAKPSIGILNKRVHDADMDIDSYILERAWLGE